MNIGFVKYGVKTREQAFFFPALMVTGPSTEPMVHRPHVVVLRAFDAGSGDFSGRHSLESCDPTRVDQTLHVWNICLHWGGLGGECRHIFQSHGVYGVQYIVGPDFLHPTLWISLDPRGSVK